MKDFRISITSATRRRELSNGTVAEYPQWYCEYKDPILNKRRRRAFNRKKDAEAFRNELLVKVMDGRYVDERKAPTVSQAIDHWLEDRETKVKSSTFQGYKVVVNGAIRGPLLIWNGAGSGEIHGEWSSAKRCPLRQTAGRCQTDRTDYCDDTRMVQDGSRAVRNLHRQSCQKPSEIYSCPCGGRFLGARAVDADRVGAGPNPSSARHPHAGPYCQGDCRRQARSGMRHLLRLSIPSRYASVRAVGLVMERCRFREEPYSYLSHSGARRIADGNDQDRSRNA